MTAPYSLFPPNSGGRIHILSSLKPVAEHVNLYLLAFLNQSEWYNYLSNRSEITEQYYQIFKSVNFIPRPLLPYEMEGKYRKLAHFLTHTFFGLPLMDVSYYDSTYIKKAGELIDLYNIDLIEVHQLHLAFIKRFYQHIPAILVEQNYEHELWPFWTRNGKKIGDRVWNQFGKLSRKYAYQIEVENTWKFEGRCFISLDEMKRAKFTNGKIFWLPTGIEPDPNEKVIEQGKMKILWVGGFDWFPNAEGAIWFAKECWPLLKERANQMEFHFIGSNPPTELVELHNGKNMFVHGFVSDIDEFWRNSDVFIVPLRSGGGIRIKIIEALRAGIPVVTTHKGCEGFPYEDRIDLLIADDPNDFVNNIIRLCEDLELRKSLSKNGKALIEQYFTPSQIGERKIYIYKAVLES